MFNIFDEHVGVFLNLKEFFCFVLNDVAILLLLMRACIRNKILEKFIFRTTENWLLKHNVYTLPVHFKRKRVSVNRADWQLQV